VAARLVGTGVSRAFDQAFQWILSVEGGYSNDTDDPGGETRWGISKRAYPHLDIAFLTKEDAKRLYLRDYWNVCHCDELQQQVALALFDSAVNQGPNKAIRLLQRALGVDADGVVGPDTIAAANRTLPGDALIQYLSHRALEYSRGQEKYRRGWFVRLFRLQRATWNLT
jgi:lysozyme family protein